MDPEWGIRRVDGDTCLVQTELIQNRCLFLGLARLQPGCHNRVAVPWKALSSAAGAAAVVADLAGSPGTRRAQSAAITAREPRCSEPSRGHARTIARRSGSSSDGSRTPVEAPSAPRAPDIAVFSEGFEACADPEGVNLIPNTLRAMRNRPSVYGHPATSAFWKQRKSKMSSTPGPVDWSQSE